MRTLLIGGVCAALIGCSCPVPPRGMVETCTSKGCFYGTVASTTVEPKRAQFKPDSAITIVKSKKVARTTALSSVKPVNAAGPEEEKVNSPIIMKLEFSRSGQPSEKPDAVKKATTTTAAKTEDPVSGQPAETSDSVLKKAKTKVAAKMEVPASAEFVDMKWAMRKNTFGQPVDTICGHVKGKKTSGEDTGERAFLYIVKEDEAYVVDSKDFLAATSYRAICNSPDLHEQNLRQQQNRE